MKFIRSCVSSAASRTPYSRLHLDASFHVAIYSGRLRAASPRLPLGGERLHRQTSSEQMDVGGGLVVLHHSLQI